MSNDGSTPLTPQQQAEADQRLAECMGRWKHAKVAVWEGGVWTDKRRCTTCGKLFTKDDVEIEEGQS